MIKVSIIVPIYNVERYLNQCIDSLLSQSLKEIEVILVDDGSPDNCGKICDEYAARDSRVKVIHKENGGVSAARNTGLAVAVGEYVIFVDSDDWVPKEAYENLYAAAKKDDADIVIGDIYRAVEGENHYCKLYDKPFTTHDRAFIDQLICAILYRSYCPCPAKNGPTTGYGGPWNKIVKTSLLRKNNFKFDLSVRGICDDMLYSAHILAVADCVVYTGKPVYHYRIISDSITRIYKKNVLEINDAIFAAWNVFMDTYGKEGQFLKPYYANVIRRLAESLPVYFFSKKNESDMKSRMEELRRVISSEPYATAAKNADLDKLSPFQRQICKMIKKQSASGIRALFSAKAILKPKG